MQHNIYTTLDEMYTILLCWFDIYPRCGSKKSNRQQTGIWEKTLEGKKKIKTHLLEEMETGNWNANQKVPGSLWPLQSIEYNIIYIINFE